MPMPIFTFIEEYDLKGKIIIPFSSHGGTMFGDSVSDLSKLVKDSYVGFGLEFNYSGGRGLSSRISDTVIDFILLGIMILMAISSIMMSGNVFAFSPFIATQFARDLHLSSTAWGFIFTALHLGLHTNSSFKKLARVIKETNKNTRFIYIIFYFLYLSFWGYFYLLKANFGNQCL